MRFYPDGADIPADLINAVDEGNAVFLCGAGVSKRADLPLFDELTQQVYERMGEALGAAPAERRAFERGEHDRALAVIRHLGLVQREDGATLLVAKRIVQLAAEGGVIQSG
jgi:hypothetical protein